MDKLEALNAATEEQAVRMLEPLIERAPEIARRVADQRPFASADDLHRAIRRELFGLDEAARIRLFCAHPELAPIDPLSMTSASQSEQARLNLTSDSNEFRARLNALNARYRDKFGFPFITALVRHTHMSSVLAEFETRLAADRQSEIEQALEQVSTVSLSRVRMNFGAGSPGEKRDAASGRQAG